MVYVASGDAKVYALDAVTGALRWSYSTGGQAYSSPAVADGVVYVGSSDNKLYALDAATGALKWSYTTGSRVDASPAVAGGVVYVGSDKVYALEAATGTLKCSYTGGGGFVAVANGVVYAASWNKTLYALDAATCSLRWTYTAGGALSSPAVANGSVYVNSSDKKTYALEAATGDLRWSYTTGSDYIQSPPAVADGVLYVGSYDRKIYAFESDFSPSVSSVSTLPTYQASMSFTVSWSGTPGTLPIVSYDIQYKDGASESWTDWLTGTTATSSTFGPSSPVAITEGHTYYFQSRARDTASNVETYPGGNGDTYTTVDLTAPTGTLQSQGWSSPYISNTVSLSISATDATSGLFQMQFGADGLTFGAWQPYATTISYVALPGTTAVYARFKDNAGNISPPAIGSINLDASPPTGSLQTQGWSSPYISNTLTLSVSAFDNTSGLSQMQFGPDGQSFAPWENSAAASLYVAPPGATSLYGRFKDRAQNVSQPVTVSINLDSAPPAGSVSINGGAAYASAISGTLTLPATDSLSGLSSMAFSSDSSSWSGWQGYADSKFWTLVSGPDGLRTPPAGTITINGGASDTNVTTVFLSVSPADNLSGVAEMSFSSDGITFSPWEPYSETDIGSIPGGNSAIWTLPGGNGTKTVYARFRDNAGNISQPYSDAIILNTSGPSSAVNPLALYQASPNFTVTWSGTAGGSGPAGFDVQYRDGALGLWTGWVTDTLSTSAVFTSTEGHTYYFQSRLRDLASNLEIFPGGDGDTRTTVDLTAPAGSVAVNSGALDTTSIDVTLSISATDSLSGVAEASYSSDGATWGGWEGYAFSRQWTLSSGDGEKVVWMRLRDAAGNVSPPVSDTIKLDTTAASAYGFAINEDALFTNQVTVTLNLPANPKTAQVMVSNGGGFYGAAWEPYSAYRVWAITQYGSYVIPRTVYVRYKDINGNISSTYQDDIILDVNAPTGSIILEGSSPVTGTVRIASTSATLKLSASDDVSGVAGMMVSNSPAFSGASWETFIASKPWTMESGGRVFVTFKDNANNASPIYAASLAGAKESLPSPALGTVHPKTGGQIASAETKTTVSFPPGAVEAKADVTLVPAVESSLENNTGAFKAAGKFLTLTARIGQTNVTSVSRPYTISVGYTAADVVGIDESSLGIYWWNGTDWVKEASSTVDTASKTVSAAINHLSSFALLGESRTRTVYLPFLGRSYGSGW